MVAAKRNCSEVKSTNTIAIVRIKSMTEQQPEIKEYRPAT